MTPGLWGYLFKYALQHQAKGNGAGFGLVDYRNEKAITRAISARYQKDGSEILINDNGLSDGYREQAKADPERNFDPNTNTPRRLTAPAVVGDSQHRLGGARAMVAGQSDHLLDRALDARRVQSADGGCDCRANPRPAAAGGCPPHGPAYHRGPGRTVPPLFGSATNATRPQGQLTGLRRLG